MVGNVLPWAWHDIHIRQSLSRLHVSRMCGIACHAQGNMFILQVHLQYSDTGCSNAINATVNEICDSVLQLYPLTWRCSAHTKAVSVSSSVRTCALHHRPCGFSTPDMICPGLSTCHQLVSLIASPDRAEAVDPMAACSTLSHSCNAVLQHGIASYKGV